MEVVVIGGSAAGLKAACRIARLQPDARVTVVERDSRVAVSACGLAYFLSGDIESAEMLVSAPDGNLKDERWFEQNKGVKVLTRTTALAIDRYSRTVRCRSSGVGNEFSVPYDRLIIAVGSEPMMPSIPGIGDDSVMKFTCLDDAVRLRRSLEKGEIKRVAILGAGFVGLELCEAFRALWGVEVDLIETQPRVMAAALDPEMARLVEGELMDNGVRLHLGVSCEEIARLGDEVAVRCSGGKILPADRVILATGVRPNSTIARAAGLAIGASGGICVDARMATNDPHIFAVGDCIEFTEAVNGHSVALHSGSLANRTGRIAGDNVCGGDSRLSPPVGALMVKVFDLSVGTVGQSASDCRMDGVDFEESWGSFHDRMFYHPGAKTINMKLIYQRGNGVLLGLQAASRGNIIHIVDLATALIQERATLDRTADLEHGYSPSYSQPFHPLQALAFIAQNNRLAGIGLISPAAFPPDSPRTLVVDVRSPDEIAAVPLPPMRADSVAIPLEQLRGRLNEIPVDREIIAVCQMGARSWDAALMLRRAGISRVAILAGGVAFLPRQSPPL